MIKDANEPLAHSARDGNKPQSYAEHVANVWRGARCRSWVMLRAAQRYWPAFQNAVEDAAVFHDLGKLDEDDQNQFKKGKGAVLHWDHIDAGVAHTSGANAWSSAWIIRGHHPPGLPTNAIHFDADQGRALRGRRDDGDSCKGYRWNRDDHLAQSQRTDRQLSRMLALHERVVTERKPVAGDDLHRLSLRLALSCLVDADHTDTARAVEGIEPAALRVRPRWGERLAQLEAYVADKQASDPSDRNAMRGRFFEDCRSSAIEAPIVSCEGPVGIGKTTAVMAFLLNRAKAQKLRRIFVIAPYTNILTQTATRLREALCLPGEDPHEVVMEHHHRADFENETLRGAAVTWRAPIIVTTAVQFFETLSANNPAMLRKLHQVPGSALFLDEAHAALPPKLWRQNWIWLKELAEQWNCTVVLASGSLARFWTDSEIVSEPCIIPELVSAKSAPSILNAERRRVRYVSIGAAFHSVEAFCNFALEKPGPRVIVLNTLQNAASVAQYLYDKKHKVFQISTALCPLDRAIILQNVTDYLKAHPRGDWTLVGTSCIEAGLDFSFRTGFRERFGLTNLLQLGGRVNRHNEFREAGDVFDFALVAGDGVTAHPAAKIPEKILRDLFKFGDFDRLIKNPAELVTLAMRREVDRMGGLGNDLLFKAEQEKNYPKVAELGRVIANQTVIAVVKQDLQEALQSRQKVGFRALLGGSVQIWPEKAKWLENLRGRDDIYYWPLQQYDSDMLGIMKWLLAQSEISTQGGAIL